MIVLWLIALGRLCKREHPIFVSYWHSMLALSLTNMSMLESHGIDEMVADSYWTSSSASSTRQPVRQGGIGRQLGFVEVEVK